MVTNIPPQYYAISARLKEAKSNEEKISVLEEMLAICPKHKGTEKLQKDLKRKIAKLKREGKRKPKKESIYYLKKEGAGQVVIIGPPSGGKSSLLNALTNARVKVSPYPFTTQIPQPGMMPYKNILIQLVDTPPLSKEFSPAWMGAIIREADGLLIVFDLSKDEVENEIQEIQEILDSWQLKKKKSILVGNKIDLEGAKGNFEKLKSQFKIRAISCLNGFGLEELKKEIFNLLEIIRVYAKPPNKEVDLTQPFILKSGASLLELAIKINPNFATNFKYAKLFKKGLKKPLIVGKDYLFQDEDVVEIHFY